MTRINAQINPSTKIVAKTVTLHDVSAGLTSLSISGKIIGGTETNTASGDHATVLGGVRNAASGSLSFIGSGQDNTASGSASFIGSGQNNIASGNRSGILGGSNNTVSHADSFIVGNGLTSNASNTTFVNNLNAQSNITSSGDLNVTEELSVEGYSEFNKRVDINTNHGGNGLRIKSNLPSNPSSNLVVEGTAKIGHDLFKQSGFSGGFASGSNHFHNLTVIDRIKNSDDDALNILRVQEKYYAIPDNFLRNNKAAFWAWHKVARTINIWNTVNLSAATLDVSALQNSSNRSSETQVPFITNTTPLKKSELVVVTLVGHDISLGQNVRMSVSTSFEGPIVAAALFGKVSAVTTNTFSIELYGGNYKTTREVPLGTDQTALSPGSVSLSIVAAENAVNPNNQVSLSHYSKTNFSPARLTDETLKATWDTPHNLIQNEHIVFITDGRGNLEIFKDGWVLDSDPDGDGLSAIIIYGNRLSQADLISFAPFDGTGWTLYKGSSDGIHKETIGDILLNFDSDNVGNYKAFQIGPGCQTDSDCIAIGKNVYNKDASTVKIGYDNAMLDVRSNGIVVDGGITIDGNIAAKSTGTGAGGAVTGNDLTIEAGQVAGDGSTAGDLLLDGGRALVISGQTVTDGKVKIGSNHTTKLEITPDTEISGDLTVSGDFTLGTINDVADKISTNTANIATNTADIDTNTADIATNTEDIASIVTYPFTTDFIGGTERTRNLTGAITSSSGFYDSNVTSAYIGTNVTSIGSNAFGYCDVLTSVTIGNSVTSIGSYAFYYCYNLTSVNIPNSVTTIGRYVFDSCAITSVNIPNSVTTIDAGAFFNCSSLTSFNIPNSVTTIGEYMFYSCTSLASVTIPNSATSIAEGIFQYCSGLESFTIPDSVTTIERYAFNGCTNLASVTIPDGVTSIDRQAFDGCTNLATINCLATTAPTLGSSVFSGVLATDIHVPVGATGYGTTYGGLTVVADL